MGAGEVVGGMVDVYAEKREPSRVTFDAEKINALLGTDLTKEQMLGYLKLVELACAVDGCLCIFRIQTFLEFSGCIGTKSDLLS